MVIAWPGLRRQLPLTLALLLLAACARTPGAAPPRTKSGAPSAAQPPAAGGPAAGGVSADAIAAFRGLGKLAFLRDGQLFVLDGAGGEVHAIAHTGAAASPAWSADGRWLAFRQGVGSSAEGIAIAGADGRVQPVAGVGNGGFVWSPAGATLAVTPATGGLWLVQPGGAPQQILTTQSGISAAWAPDGQSLAYAITLPFTQPEDRDDSLFTVPVSGGKPTQQFISPRSGIQWFTWTPDGTGVLFWQDPVHSASLAADGVPLLRLPLPGSDARKLAVTLTRPEWLSWAPDGQRLALVEGSGRELWRGKSVSICTPAQEHCQPLLRADDGVSLDPAWSPAGGQITFVRADALNQAPGDARTGGAWAASRTLWLAGADGQGTRALTAAGTGVYAPAWAKDGRHLLFVRENALWLIDTEKGAPVRLLDFPPSTAQNAFYGSISYGQAYAWFRG